MFNSKISLFNDHSSPSVLVLLCAILDATEMVIELCGDWTWLAVLAEGVTFACVEVVDVRNRTDHGSCAASTSLLEGVEFVLRYLTALHLHAIVLSQLHQALVGDAGENGCGLRCDVSVLLETEEVGSTTHVHIFLFLGVEIELASVALLMGDRVGLKRSGIVATHLIDTCAKWS